MRDGASEPTLTYGALRGTTDGRRKLGAYVIGCAPDQRHAMGRSARAGRPGVTSNPRSAAGHRLLGLIPPRLAGVDRNLHPAIATASILAVVAGHRLRLPEPARGHPAVGHAMGGEVALGRVGAPLRQVLIVGVAA